MPTKQKQQHRPQQQTTQVYNFQTTEHLIWWKNLKETRGSKQLSHRGTKMRIISDFFSVTMQVRKTWVKYIKHLKKKPTNPGFCTLWYYPSKLKKK